MASNTTESFSLNVTLTEEKIFVPWNNPKNIFSHATEQLFYLILSCSLTVPISVIGIPLNLINIIVFTKQVSVDIELKE